MSRNTTATSTRIRYSLDSPPCGEDDALTVSTASQSLSLRTPMRSCNFASIDAHANFAHALARSARAGLTIVHKPQFSSSMQAQLSLSKHSRQRTGLLHQIPDQLALGCVKTADPIACFLVRTHQRRSHTTHPRQRSSTHSTKSSRTRVSVSLPDPRTSSLASCETANLRGRPAGSTVGYSPARPCTKGSLFLALSPKQPQGQDPLVENGHLVNWKASPYTFIP
jgi:hypothetical protein